MKRTAHVLVGWISLALVLTNVQASCTGYYVQERFVLQGNLLASLLVTSQAQCEMECRENSGCFSINYYKEQKKCHLNKATHLSRPLHLVYDMGGVYIKIKNDYCSDAYCTSGQSCLIDSSKNDYVCKVCNAPLGLESGTIPNNRISASSYYVVQAGHEPWRGRLRMTQGSGHVGSWEPKNSKAGEYLQVDFGKICRVTKVATQGRPNHFHRITSYNLSYALNEGTFTDYKVGGTLKVFSGNTADAETIVTNVLPVPIRCRYIRFVVVTFSSHPAMRAEVYGCPEN